MKKLHIVTIIISLFFTIVIINGCKSSSVLADAKSGAQLWGENCIRCHNTPSPETFGDQDWDVAVMHMRIRANLTEHESVKIAEFLKTAN